MSDLEIGLMGKARNFTAVWRTFVKRNVIDNVPNEIAACLDCDELKCSGERYDHCPVRLTTADALDAVQT
jgi:hypothetical protein